MSVMEMLRQIGKLRLSRRPVVLSHAGASPAAPFLVKFGPRRQSDGQGANTKKQVLVRQTC